MVTVTQSATTEGYSKCFNQLYLQYLINIYT